MTWLIITTVALIFIAGFYQIKLWFFSFSVLSLELGFYSFDVISNLQFILTFAVTLALTLTFTFKKLRKHLITRHLYSFLQHSNNNWSLFQRIDTGWFSSDFEKSIFQGNPDFSLINSSDESPSISEIEEKINDFLKSKQKSSHISQINKIAKIGLTSLLIDKEYGGQGYNYSQIATSLQQLSKINPVLAAITGLLNLDSLASLLSHFASPGQKKKYLPLFSQAKMIPFLKPTSLYETLDNQKSSVEGRIEKDFHKGKETLGIRVSFQDIILLGTSLSNCFYINVNVKDFNNIHGKTTHLGTAICIINSDIEGLNYHKGLKAYNQYLYYYSCTGRNIFIPFCNILNEESGIGSGLEYLYKNQAVASSIWPLAISIPTNTTSTLTSWYFAHLQKQNGRQLLSYKIVMAKLNEQFSQCLKFQLLNKLGLQNKLKPMALKFTAILNKNTHIAQTMEQLELLRGILGSNSHNIKTESKVRSFYKVSHLTTELDGMSHEINQLPLIKKAALACHPYYCREVEILSNKENYNLNEFDLLIFRHLGYILQNLIKVWVYTLRTSALGKLFFRKSKYKCMIKRMSASFAFLSDITLINWTFKKKINTSFAGQLGECIQNLTTSTVLQNYYTDPNKQKQNKELAKSSLKNTLYDCQSNLKTTINLAFNRFPALLMKLLIFPFGKPFHKITTFKPLHNDIEYLCKADEDKHQLMTSYSPFLKKIFDTKQQLKQAESAENAVTNATGTPLTTDNYEVLINRCLAAGILSIEQSEQLREAYQSIQEIKLTNHFGNNYEK